MKRTTRFAPALLLALPFLVALGPHVVAATRSMHIKVSGYGDQLRRVVQTGASRAAGVDDRDTTLVNAD